MKFISSDLIAPTIACVVETGKPTLVIKYTDIPAATHAAKAPGNALIAPNLPKVSVVPAPLIIAPRITKTLQIIAALVKLTKKTALVFLVIIFSSESKSFGLKNNVSTPIFAKDEKKQTKK